MISINKVLNGFLRNYGMLNIVESDNYTSWTYKSMDYFNQLGKLLGYNVKFERHRYDLTWHSYKSKKVYLHVEHENKSSRVDKTINKIMNKSDSIDVNMRIGIVYPKAGELLDEVNKFKERDTPLSKDEDVMIIFLGFFDESDKDGYWYGRAIRKWNSDDIQKSKDRKFRMAANENGILYCIL